MYERLYYGSRDRRNSEKHNKKEQKESETAIAYSGNVDEEHETGGTRRVSENTDKITNEDDLNSQVKIGGARDLMKRKKFQKCCKVRCLMETMSTTKCKIYG